MATKIRSIGTVELWRDEYTDAKLKSDTYNALANLQTQFNSPQKRTDYEAKYTIPLQRLTSAIAIAPVMAKVAIARLTSLLMDHEVSSAGMGSSSPDREKFVDNTVLALFKYFNLSPDLRKLPRNHPHWLNVERIYGVYERTLVGLSQPYKIFLYEPQNTGVTEKAMGFVRRDVNDNPLYEYFRTAPDQDGHIPYPNFPVTGHIHLRMDALTKKMHAVDGKNQGAVAALLLHEATHKWAHTRDICYKWDTIAQKLKHKEWEKKEEDRTSGNGFGMKQAMKDGKQPALFLPGRAKPVLAMAKANVTADQWVYNADSYSCAARRLWKETMASSSANDWDD